MNYLIAVLPDRTQAEAAYSALEADQFPMDGVSILGNGYKSADEFGFLDPQETARKQAKFMSFWLVPFGFIGGFAFNASTQFILFPWAGMIGNHLIGALLGAVAGAMGSFFIGGGTGLLFGNNDDNESLPIRKRLNEGKYILVVKGAPNFTNRANRLLKPLKPETIQNYVDPTA
ncbi:MULTISPECIES: hypothetical protein [unclassified Leptolyngbya]|uniref:hypothetical protein n=1 Tax=unclassified Leptolyngbya TaxID=2650499 RepID=UPI001683A9C7|nr:MULTISPECIES: hypothetical protein [unclassified Leptolyngbya]MBD1911077.1 hypothetical protein [Leptolyngbya sp. FACHB-8]MBD2152921.1 hypothetical protein [Leptolyngbya sp. FACHB-16]